MPLLNTDDTYGSLAKFFHWFIAILVLLMLSIGVSFNYLPKSNFVIFLVQVHKSLGITIGGLMLIRLLWRLINRRPPLPLAMPQWERLLTQWTHALFYITLILMPTTGVIMSFAAGYPIQFWWLATIHLTWIPKNKTLVDLMVSVHGYLAWTISALIVIHILGALKHHFINKDNVLLRMWPKRKKKESLFHR